MEVTVERGDADVLTMLVMNMVEKTVFRGVMVTILVVGLWSLVKLNVGETVLFETPIVWLVVFLSQVSKRFPNTKAMGSSNLLCKARQSCEDEIEPHVASALAVPDGPDRISMDRQRQKLDRFGLVGGLKGERLQTQKDGILMHKGVFGANISAMSITSTWD